jgi:hypothetical protein
MSLSRRTGAVSALSTVVGVASDRLVVAAA